MNNQSIQKVVILGGGTAGWITASLLAKVLGKRIDITLVESDDIGIVGVGEASIPPMVNFNNALGIDEKDFIRQTNATIKMGIQFEHWKQQGESYMHAFGSIGKNFPFCDFHHFWNRSQQLGIQSNFWDFSLNYQAAKQNKFAHLNQIEGNLPGIAHAYHFDAGLYAKYLRNHCEKLGVTRVEGRVDEVRVNPKNGYIDRMVLAEGRTITGDLFIDCSGMRAVLIEKTLGIGFEDWSHWLPCNRAITVPTEAVSPVTPYTRSIAHTAGWQWRIPLQHRTGNGIVYASNYLSDEQAKHTLLTNLDAKPLAEPRTISFKTGRRAQQWHKNVVSIGLSSGFLEPLESTSIHLIQTAVIRLIKHFPHQQINDAEVQSYNRQSQAEMEHIRDFIILHYKLTERDDSPFWRQCRIMQIPPSLKEKINLFKQTGKVFREQEELFAEVAWQQVFLGQGAIPEDIHPLASSLSEQQIRELLSNLKLIIDRNVDKLPLHQQFIDSL
ncbi:tryptophan halogenase family protein [Neptunicella sp. SCSIO 80796]|uniref:tryptophan halogenase family protein n=1 Tax=Neptunicella plasticusilytica TaxID=3117012 RepID=UPI003A4D3A43